MNNIFIVVLQLTIAGGITGVIILPFAPLIYRNTSAQFMVYVYAMVICMFVFPFFHLFTVMGGTKIGDIIQASIFERVVFIKNESFVERYYDFLKEFPVLLVLRYIWCEETTYLRKTG